jgi:hypothetical protein
MVGLLAIKGDRAIRYGKGREEQNSTSQGLQVLRSTRWGVPISTESVEGGRAGRSGARSNSRRGVKEEGGEEPGQPVFISKRVSQAGGWKVARQRGRRLRARGNRTGLNRCKPARTGGKGRGVTRACLTISTLPRPFLFLHNGKADSTLTEAAEPAERASRFPSLLVHAPHTCRPSSYTRR